MKEDAYPIQTLNRIIVIDHEELPTTTTRYKRIAMNSWVAKYDGEEEVTMTDDQVLNEIQLTEKSSESVGVKVSFNLMKGARLTIKVEREEYLIKTFAVETLRADAVEKLNSDVQSFIDNAYDANYEIDVINTSNSSLGYVVTVCMNYVGE